MKLQTGTHQQQKQQETAVSRHNYDDASVDQSHQFIHCAFAEYCKQSLPAETPITMLLNDTFLVHIAA